MASKRKANRSTREYKKTRGEVRETKPKFEVKYKDGVAPVRALNEKQQDYIVSINTNPLTIATGYAGTSKTYLPTAIACDMLKLGQVDKIILTRPNVSDSKSLGFFSGDLVEKMRNWLLPVLDTMVERLGSGMVDYCIAKGKIEFVPLEVIKGRSFNSAFILGDEAEDLTYAEVKKIITRLGSGSKMVLAGDITQKDLHCESGLSIALHMAKNSQELNCGWVDFNEIEDIVRSETVKRWIVGFNKYERGN